MFDDSIEYDDIFPLIDELESVQDETTAEEVEVEVVDPSVQQVISGEDIFLASNSQPQHLGQVPITNLPVINDDDLPFLDSSSNQQQQQPDSPRAKLWNTDLEQESNEVRSSTPNTILMASHLQPHFSKGNFKINDDEFHVKAHCLQTLELFSVPVCGQVLVSLERPTEYAHYPVTGDGHIGYPTDPKGSDLKMWAFRAFTKDPANTNYIKIGDVYAVVVNLDNEKDVSLKFARISTHLSEPEKMMGLKPGKAKKMELVIASIADPNIKATVKIQIVTEPRDNAVVKDRKSKSKKSVQEVVPKRIKREPEMGMMMPEPEMVPNMMTSVSVVAPSHSHPAPPMTKEEKIERIRRALLSSDEKIVDAHATILGVV